MDVNAISAAPPSGTRSAPEAPGARPRPAPAAPARPGPAAGRPEPEPPEPDLKFTLQSADAQARFVVHSASKRVMVTIYDRQTGEVIREIPPKRILDIMAAITGRGTMVDAAG
jgi:hypothetical protein